MAIVYYLRQLMADNNSTQVYDQHGNVYHMQDQDDDNLISYENDSGVFFKVHSTFLVEITPENNLVPFTLGLSNGKEVTITDIRISKSIFPLDYLNNI